ncbi:MAG: hypothetical protein PHT54_01125 [Candidatus Nanoarchaeia archaeon]|nr:hypothetical protein [Candidatus Nanoarchaeia archaeon]
MKKRSDKSSLIPIISIIVIIAVVAVVCVFLCDKTDSIEESTGGVIICGQDFKCGEDDGVCPEDFGAECKCDDVDCGGSE